MYCKKNGKFKLLNCFFFFTFLQKVHIFISHYLNGMHESFSNMYNISNIPLYIHNGNRGGVVKSPPPPTDYPGILGPASTELRYRHNVIPVNRFCNYSWK